MLESKVLPESEKENRWRKSVLQILKKNSKNQENQSLKIQQFFLWLKVTESDFF